MVKFRDLQPGMKVRLVASAKDVYNNKRDWLGKIMTVRCFGHDDKRRRSVFFEEDVGSYTRGIFKSWPWHEDHIAEIVDDPSKPYTLEDMEGFFGEFFGGELKVG